MDTRKYLRSLLSKVAEKLNWNNFDVSADIEHETGNGFLGEFFLVSVLNKDTNEKVDVAVKKAYTGETRRKEVAIGKAFENEIYFYETIIPRLLKFKDGKNVTDSYDFFTTFYGSGKNEFEESIIMENLRSAGYDIIGRENLLDEKHVEFIFKTYGKFHALTFAFKDQHYEEYKDMMKKPFDFMGFIKQSDAFRKSYEASLVEGFQGVDENIRKACRRYYENPLEIFEVACDYKGKYSSLVHGDCWSNNMMFKNKGSDIENMKLIDFQLLTDDTPVHDLSYCLYAGGTKELYQNIDQYLKIYHDSFSKACRELGSDPEKLFPFEALKQDWKEYSKWGIIMGVTVNKMKLLKQDAIEDLTGDTEFLKEFSKIKVNETERLLFEQRMKDLLEDVYKRGFLSE